MSQEWVNGLVMRYQAGFYYVETGAEEVVSCKLRGRLKRGAAREDIAAIGDRVLISLQPDGSGMIEEVLERHHALVRSAPTGRGEYMQVLLANPDQVVLVFSCAQPAPRLRMLDRFLVICEKQSIPPLIVANKVDLVGMDKAREMFSMYPPIGYPVLYTSAATGEGAAELAEHLYGKLSGLAGPSGVGKSSLLNVIQPALGLAVSEVSEWSSKGRHTTVVRELFPLEGGGYVADLPGLRSLSLWDTEPEELDGYFPDLSPLVADCQFSDCTHQIEPGCAVKAAVERGEIHPERYESYLRLRNNED